MKKGLEQGASVTWGEGDGAREEGKATLASMSRPAPDRPAPAAAAKGTASVLATTAVTRTPGRSIIIDFRLIHLFDRQERG